MNSFDTVKMNLTQREKEVAKIKSGDSITFYSQKMCPNYPYVCSQKELDQQKAEKLE